MTWILMSAWLISPGPYATSRALTMQEFNTLQACQFASVEAQKIAPGVRVVCVQKGVK